MNELTADLDVAIRNRPFRWHAVPRSGYAIITGVGYAERMGFRIAYPCNLMIIDL